MNRQVGAPVGNIEVSVRVESKRQVLPVFGTLILVSPVKFILLLPLGGSNFRFVCGKRFSIETGNLSIIDPAQKRVQAPDNRRGYPKILDSSSCTLIQSCK
ncbi:hypothetical protein QUB60_10240 [Microcoleus sp. A2-C5]|uniref:hypothetical protein n=1 Tax=unclassified Microcoleus TaxID=2642155 RepID=UPI002FD16251